MAKLQNSKEAETEQGPKQQEHKNNPFQSYSKYVTFTLPLRRICQFNLFKNVTKKKNLSAMGRWKRFSDDNGNSAN